MLANSFTLGGSKPLQGIAQVTTPAYGLQRGRYEKSPMAGKTPHHWRLENTIDQTILQL